MSEFLKCKCSNCGQNIEYPSEGTGETIPCPTCEMPVTLMLANPPTKFSSTEIPPATATVAPTVAQMPKEKKIVRTNLAKLTEETIRARTKAGDTPLHRAAKNGQFDLIPSHLLNVELFMVRNNDGNTPLHIAARNGTLNQVSRQFLTKETLTIRATPQYAAEGFYFTGSGYKALTETVLHIAALYGHGNQIHEEFLTPEFLSIEAKGHAQTVLHYFAISKSLDLIPQIYANSEMWQHKDRQGMTARDVQETFIKQEQYVANVRNEPVTEKQKEKLRWFGYTVEEGMTKGEASDALDKCVKDFPEKDWAYYNRPATEEQMGKIRVYLKDTPDEIEESYTYREAKDLIWECEMEKRHEDEINEMEELDYHFTICEFLRWRDDVCPNLTFARVKKAAEALDKINPQWTKDTSCQELLRQKVVELYPGILEEDLTIKCWDEHAKLTELFKLQELPPRAEDLELFARHGIAYYEGDAFSICAAADLVRCFESMFAETGEYTNISMASAAASEDPAIKKATIILGQDGQLVFTWPKRKLEQWYRKGAKY